VNIVLAFVVLCPAVVAFGFSVFWLFKWIAEQRKTTTSQTILVGFLGLFSVFVPRLQSFHARRFFRNFAVSFASFAAYSILLFAVINASTQ